MTGAMHKIGCCSASINLISRVPSSAPPSASMPGRLSTHLRRLESEAIHILREVVAEFRKPVMLYSIGKDSSVMLHVALKAFHPAKPPFPLLHVDTTWKFKEMIAFRARRRAGSGWSSSST